MQIRQISTQIQNNIESQIYDELLPKGNIHVIPVVYQMLAMVAISSSTPSDVPSRSHAQSGPARTSSPQAQAPLTQGDRSGDVTPATQVDLTSQRPSPPTASTVYQPPKPGLLTTTLLLDRLADSNAEVTRVLRRQPDFKNVTAAAFQHALAQAFPAAGALNPDYIYVTAYDETERVAASASQKSSFTRTATSSQTLTQALQTAISTGISPTYNQSRTGFFYLPNNAGGSCEVGAMKGSAHLLTFERILQQAVSAGARPQQYQQAVRHFWNTPDDSLALQQTPKAWLSAEYRMQRQTEAQLRVGDGTLNETSRQWLLHAANVANVAELRTSASKPGIFSLSLQDDAGAIPFSGIAVFTRSPKETPDRTAGPVLLMIPGQGLMEFGSAAAYRGTLQQCFDSAPLRTTLLTHVTRGNRERADAFGNALDAPSALRYQAITGPLFADRLQSQIDQQLQDIAWASRYDKQHGSPAGTSTGQLANLQNRFDVTGIMDARQLLLRRRELQQTEAHDREITRFTESMSASIPLSPAAYADQLIAQRWGNQIDPRNTRLVTLHYDYAGHEAAAGMPRQGNVARAMSLTDALLRNYQVVGDDLVGENAFGLYTPPRVGPTVELNDAVKQYPIDLGHYTYEGIYRQSPQSEFSPATQISEITPAEFKQWVWSLDFKEKYRTYLQSMWPSDRTPDAAEAGRQRTLVKTAFVKTAFVQYAENSLSAAGLRLALQGAGLDPRQHWNDITPQQLSSSTVPTHNVEVAPLAIDGRTSTDMLTCRDRNSNRILLYIPGNSSPLHEFDNPAALQSWIATQARDLTKREALLRHFAATDIEDSGHLLWKKTGVRSALDGIAAYPHMRSVDQQQYAGAIYPHHRPTEDELWNPARYVQFPALAADQDPFAQLVLGIRKSMQAMVDDKIRDKADVRWEHVNWYIQSAIKLAQSPLALPLMLEFPMSFALTGLVDAGYAVNQALNGKTAQERHAGATRAAFGLFNAVPFVAYAGQALKTGTATAQAINDLDQSGNTIVRDALDVASNSVSDVPGNDIAGDFMSTAFDTVPANRLRPAHSGMISAYAVPEASIAGLQPDIRGIYQAADRWYIRYTDDSGINAPYEIKSNFRVSDNRVQIIDPDSRQPLLTVEANADGAWQRLTGPGGMPRTSRLKQLQQAKEAETTQMSEDYEKWAGSYGRIVEALQGPDLRTHLLGISGAVVVKNNVRMELLAVMEADSRATRLSFSDFASNPALLRERIESRIEDMAVITRNYRSALETYEAIKDADTRGYRKLINMVRGEDAATQPQTQMSAVRRMLEAETAIISEVRTLHALSEDELDRLLTRLDTLKAAPQKAVPPRRVEKPGPSRTDNSAAGMQQTPPRPAVPKNRVDIRTVEGHVLSGKPRTDNPDIVDILDRRNQRKATYLRSPNEEYWIAYTPVQPAVASGQTASVDAAGWNQLGNKFKKVLDEVKSAESIVDFLVRKGDGLPSTPAGILDHSANRMKETAREIADIRGHLTTDENRRQADAMITALRDKATELSNKGQGIRVTMILQAPPTANDLEYLAQRGLLQIRKTQSRVAVDRNVTVAPATRPQRVPDYMDEFEIKASGKVWAYAHMHYPAADTAAENFSAAHLKIPAQRYRGANAQGEAQAQGRRLVIHRGELYGPLVRKIFFPEMQAAAASSSASLS